MNDMSNCGCCAGTAIDTPAVKFNRPGLSAIAYRIGRHRDFKATLLARLSVMDYPALHALTTRDDSDYTVAVCDAFATLADVLTFYQERIANESFLRTATERRSVLELARLVGYELAPGVAASTVLAFTLESAPGMPALAAQPVTIPIGTRVQSVPDAGQDPQTFETTAAITGRVEWNAIPAQTSKRLIIQEGLKELYLAGTNPQIQAGDVIALIGGEREEATNYSLWEVRRIDGVDVDMDRNVTRITWSLPLSNIWPVPPSAKGVRVYVFRQRASLFGHNAPDARLIYNTSNPDLNQITFLSGGVRQWVDFHIVNREIDLDATYPKIVENSWIALTETWSYFDVTTSLWTAYTYSEVHRVTGVSQSSRSDFGLSAKITRLQPDVIPMEVMSWLDLRGAQVLAQSEELALAERPLTYPVYGNELDIGQLHPNFAPQQLIAISGKCQRVSVGAATEHVFILLEDGTWGAPLPGQSFLVRTAPQKWVAADKLELLAPEQLDPSSGPLGWVFWVLEDGDGTQVEAWTLGRPFMLQPALKKDETVSEVCTIASLSHGVGVTKVSTEQSMTHCYDRATVVVNANVAPATHGETVSEIAGSGDASRPNQNFPLKQSPLTYVSTPADPSGRASTLQVRVNDVLWHEAPTLHGRGPLDRVYELRHDDDSKTTIHCGDAVQGARLPSGQNNVRLSYRKGLGVGGNLRANQLTTLLTRPLGVKAATNPSPSTGGEDAEALAAARKNAPLRVRTLGRAVSIHDYVGFSAAFAGIAKAHGLWINDGRARGIHLTVAGPGGAKIPDDSDTLKNLVGALRRYGDSLLPLTVRTYYDAKFLLEAAIKIDADADGDKVLAAVESALRSAYAFEAREFGQPVTIDDVYATIHTVPGVVAADISLLCRKDDFDTEPQPWLVAALPSVQDGSVTPAELLTLDPAPLDLGVMA